MKTKLLVLMLATFTFVASNGQSVELPNVTRQGFKGLRPMDNGGYYVQFIEGTTGKGNNIKPILHLFILDNDLKVTSDFTLELQLNETVDDISFNGGNFMIVSSGIINRSRTFRIVDGKGTELKKKFLEDLNRRLFDKPVVIMPIDESDFLVINYIKEKKVGYSIERYTKNMDVLFAQERVPEKKKLFPVDYTVSGDNLFVLEYLDADMNDSFEYTVTPFNTKTGSPGPSIALVSADAKAYGFATFIKSLKDGGVVTGGMYFNEPKTQESNSDGFFASSISKEGVLKFSYVDWKDAMDKLKDKSTSAMWGGKTKTFMHDLWVNEDGTITLIGENYRKGDAALAGEKSKSAFAIAGKIGSGGQDMKTAVTAAEFTLMDFDATGAFTGIRKVDKPDAVTIIQPTEDVNDKPVASQQRGLNLANILNNNGFMPYRFVAGGKTPYLVYWQRYDPLVREYVYFTPINATQMDTVSVEVTGSDLKLMRELQEKILSKLGAFGKLAKKGNEVSGATHENTFLLRGSHDPFDYRGKKLNTRIIPSNVPGKIAIYDFIPKVDDSEKKGMTAQMVATANGTLKIWYITIPVHP